MTPPQNPPVCAPRRCRDQPVGVAPLHQPALRVVAQQGLGLDVLARWRVAEQLEHARDSSRRVALRPPRRAKVRRRRVGVRAVMLDDDPRLALDPLHAAAGPLGRRQSTEGVVPVPPQRASGAGRRVLAAPCRDTGAIPGRPVPGRPSPTRATAQRAAPSALWRRWISRPNPSVNTRVITSRGTTSWRSISWRCSTNTGLTVSASPRDTSSSYRHWTSGGAPTASSAHVAATRPSASRSIAGNGAVGIPYAERLAERIAVAKHCGAVPPGVGDTHRRPLLGVVAEARFRAARTEVTGHQAVPDPPGCPQESPPQFDREQRTVAVGGRQRAGNGRARCPHRHPVARGKYRRTAP